MPELLEHGVIALLLPGPDQLSEMREIEAMVGDKSILLVFNRQYTRKEDFGFFNSNEAKDRMERFRWGYAFQKIA